MDKKRTVLHFILQYIGITIASIMYAMALAWFLNPNQLAPGGVSGIAIVLKEIFPFLPGIGALILIFNIPILLLGVWKFGVKFTISTIYTVVFSSIVIDLIPSITALRPLLWILCLQRLSVVLCMVLPLVFCLDLNYNRRN